MRRERFGSLPWQLAWRYLRGRRSRLLGGTARAALGSIALGVAAMVVAMALMSGYRDELERKLVAGNAAIVVYALSEGRQVPPQQVEHELMAIPGVSAVRRVEYAQGTLEPMAGGESREVTLRGVEEGGDRMVPAGISLAAEAGAPGAVVLGRELARAVGARPGDLERLTLLAATADRPRFRFVAVRVVGTFETGFSEFDRGWAVVDRTWLTRLTGARSSENLFEVMVDDLSASARLAEAARQRLGEGFLVTDWRELNRELFTALRVQQVALFFVLGLIVLVSTFNVASTLMVLVRERMRDVGVLAAMGLAPAGLRATFLVAGGLLGVVGTGLGALAGATIAWALTTFHLIRFDADVAAIYFINSVPFRVRAVDVAAVVAFALSVTLLACWVPARWAARANPSEALRYE